MEKLVSATRCQPPVQDCHQRPAKRHSHTHTKPPNDSHWSQDATKKMHLTKSLANPFIGKPLHRRLLYRCCLFSPLVSLRVSLLDRRLLYRCCLASPLALFVSLLDRCCLVSLAINDRAKKYNHHRNNPRRAGLAPTYEGTYGNRWYGP